MPYLDNSRGLTAALSAGGGQVLPEEGVVAVSTTVEVEKRSNRGSLGEVTLALSLGNSLERAVQAGNVGLMVLLVMKLHDLAGDVGLESAIVVCEGIWSAIGSIIQKQVADQKRATIMDLHWRSGRVALPRTKAVLARAAAGLVAPAARRAPRRAGVVRRRAEDIVKIVIVRLAAEEKVNCALRDKNRTLIGESKRRRTECSDNEACSEVFC